MRWELEALPPYYHGENYILELRIHHDDFPVTRVYKKLIYLDNNNAIVLGDEELARYMELAREQFAKPTTYGYIGKSRILKRVKVDDVYRHYYFDFPHNCRPMIEANISNRDPEGGTIQIEVLVGCEVDMAMAGVGEEGKEKINAQRRDAILNPEKYMKRGEPFSFYRE